MAPSDPMPRYDLYERPWYRITSPGASSVPANSDPIITVCAPAAIAFTALPEYLIPPSEMQGTPKRDAARTHASTALICGTPTPATTRVVQMLPGPIPTLTASTPASQSAAAPSPVATLPATSSMSLKFLRSERTASTTPFAWPCAVSTQMMSQPARKSACTRSSRSGPTPTAAPTRRRPCSSLAAFGNWRVFSMSLMVMRPLSSYFSSTTRSFSILFTWSSSFAASCEMPSRQVMSSRVITSSTRCSRFFSKRMSRLVRMPTSRPLRVTGIPLISCCRISSTAWYSRASGSMVTGSTTIPLSYFLTLVTSSACWATPRILWMKPIPPDWAIAMAVRASVTVSMAALTNGIFWRMLRVSCADTSTWRGRISLSAGSSSTSSKVSASGRFGSSMGSPDNGQVYRPLSRAANYRAIPGFLARVVGGVQSAADVRVRPRRTAFPASWRTPSRRQAAGRRAPAQASLRNARRGGGEVRRGTQAVEVLHPHEAAAPGGHPRAARRAALERTALLPRCRESRAGPRAAPARRAGPAPRRRSGHGAEAPRHRRRRPRPDPRSRRRPAPAAQDGAGKGRGEALAAGRRRASGRGQAREAGDARSPGSGRRRWPAENGGEAGQGRKARAAAFCPRAGEEGFRDRDRSRHHERLRGGREGRKTDGHPFARGVPDHPLHRRLQREGQVHRRPSGEEPAPHQPAQHGGRREAAGGKAVLVAGGDRDRRTLRLRHHRGGQRRGGGAARRPGAFPAAHLGDGARRGARDRPALARHRGPPRHHHRPRLLQRQSAAGSPRGRRPRRNHRRTDPQRADGRGARLRPRAYPRAAGPRLRPRRRHLRRQRPRAARERLRGGLDRREHVPRRRRLRQGDRRPPALCLQGEERDRFPRRPRRPAAHH